MTFILSALILCILAAHNFDSGRYLIGSICLICSAFIPVFLHDCHKRINRAPACRADTHRGGNGYTLAPFTPAPLATSAILNTMSADLDEIKSDLQVMVNMSQELRMCLASTPDHQP